MNRSKTVRASKLLLSLSALCIVGSLTACGGYSPSTAKRQSTSTTLGGSLGDIGVSDPNSTNPSGTGSDTGSVTTPAPHTGLPAYNFEIHGVGYTAQTFTVQARHTLKVKFAPGLQDRNIEGTGASPQYAGLGVFITVGSMTQPTPLLLNGYAGTQAESHTLDFTNQFTDTCPASDTACRNTVTITVKNPNYDYWCINFGMGCPWTHVSDNHPWHATLTVQTDDTDGL